MIEFKDTTISDMPTGDPFVDAGGNALKHWISIQPHELLMDVIKDIVSIYVDKWEGKINAVFLNSKITHPSKKTSNDKITATIEHYQYLLSNNDKKRIGFCRTCGNKGTLTLAGRDQFCLSGSGHFVNYHHGHEEGISICKDCSIKLFFLPLTVLLVGGKLAILQTTTKEGNMFWLEETVQRNIEKIGRKSTEGILKSKFTKPQNALFQFANRIIEKINDTSKSDSLQLYHFTNFGATPECDFYFLPNPIFSFIAKVQKSCKIEWNIFIKRHYFIKQSMWKAEDEKWINSKTNQILIEDEYQNNYNLIYQNLLESKSILSQLSKFYKELFRNNKAFYNSLMVTLYVMEVLNMKKEQVDLIKKVTHVIFILAQKNQSFKKYLYQIEGAGKAYQLRLALIKIIKDNYQSGADEPVLRLDDYVNYLFPDGQYWGEVRDLMLIYFYEKMHDAKISTDVLPEIEINETEEELINEL